MENRYHFDCGCSVRILEEKQDSYRLKIDYEELLYDLNYSQGCPEVWKMLGEGRTKGVFQLEGYLGKQWSEKLSPDSLRELALLVSIIRPSCLQAVHEGKNMSQHIVDRKHGKEPVIPLHNSLETILNDSYQIMVFQEDSIRIVVNIAGFSEEEADNLRKAIGKKDAKLMAEIRQKFLAGCKKMGIVDDKMANIIFDWIQESQRYAFNQCISGKEKIKRASKNDKNFYPTIEEMYKIKNDIQYAKKTGHYQLYKKWKLNNNYGYGLSLNEDGRIYKNIIKDIRYAGYRTVYKITTDKNRSITVTDNHNFPTPEGKKRCDELKIGNILYVCGEYEVNKSTYRMSSVEQEKKNKTYDGCGFPKGIDNPAYTNGSFSLFKENKKKLPDYCQICNKKSNRLECHHINGDRTNSNIENLQNLCPSCHKKEEYKLGRNKRGDKGYPSLQEKIIEIKEIGKENVYDVEMEAPNHNFVIENNIVTCNSHATSYGQVGYLTAFAKYHFPIQFFASYLSFAKEKLDHVKEIKELIDEAKKFDIPVLTPTLESLFTYDCNMSIDKKVIRFGLRSMKFFGESAIEKLSTKVTQLQKDFGTIDKWNWNEILYRLLPEINSQCATALITSGVLDKFGITRSKMLLEYQKVKLLSKKQLEHLISFNLPLIEGLEKLEEKVNSSQKVKIKDLRTLVENSTHSMKDRISWVVSSEKEIYGTSITYDPVDLLKYGSDANTTCKEFIEGKDGDLVMCGEVESAKHFKIKSGKNAGKMMAKAQLNDGSAIIECVLFQKNYDNNCKILEDGNLVRIKGKRSDSNSLIIDTIEEIY